MKKFLIVLLCGVSFFSYNLVLAQQSQQGIHEAGTGIADPELMETNQGTGQGLQGSEDDARGDLQGSAATTGSNLGQEAGKGGQENATGAQMGSGESVSRKNRASNARQSMLEVAERNQGINQQVQNITQNQVQAQEEAENALGVAQKRNGFIKFFIGPDYGQLKEVEDRLERHEQNLEELKQLRISIEDKTDASLFDDQIKVMEEVKQELEGELGKSGSGFSLFGWMNRLFNS